MGSGQLTAYTLNLSDAFFKGSQTTVKAGYRPVFFYKLFLFTSHLNENRLL